MSCSTRMKNQWSASAPKPRTAKLVSTLNKSCLNWKSSVKPTWLRQLSLTVSLMRHLMTRSWDRKSLRGRLASLRRRPRFATKSSAAKSIRYLKKHGSRSQWMNKPAKLCRTYRKTCLISLKCAMRRRRVVRRSALRKKRKIWGSRPRFWNTNLRWRCKLKLRSAKKRLVQCRNSDTEERRNGWKRSCMSRSELSRLNRTASANSRKCKNNSLLRSKSVLKKLKSYATSWRRHFKGTHCTSHLVLNLDKIAKSNHKPKFRCRRFKQSVLKLSVALSLNLKIFKTSLSLVNRS